MSSQFFADLFNGAEDGRAVNKVEGEIFLIHLTDSPFPIVDWRLNGGLTS